MNTVPVLQIWVVKSQKWVVSRVEYAVYGWGATADAIMRLELGMNNIATQQYMLSPQDILVTSPTSTVSLSRNWTTLGGGREEMGAQVRELAMTYAFVAVLVEPVHLVSKSNCMKYWRLLST